MKAIERAERLVKFPKVFKDILLGFDGEFQWDFSVIDDTIIRRHVEYYASVFPIKEIIVSESYLYLLLKPRKKLPINVEEITSMA